MQKISAKSRVNLGQKIKKKPLMANDMLLQYHTMLRILPEKGPCPAGSKVTVIIPVLNESKTVSSVVEFAMASPMVDEVLVVDDGSIDGTPELAKAAGATVFTSTMLGKGASMEDGVRVARNETLLFLDGDLRGLQHDLVELMIAPILASEADFVKARFTRDAGRVTVLTARPLLRSYFPEVAQFHQPLGGIMAAKRSVLQGLRFENDYGVDIGLLIDAAMSGARLAEVDVGRIEHDSHPLEVLEDMAMQVARTILDRAASAGRMRLRYIAEVREKERHDRASISAFLERLPNTERLALFDMDGVLLDGRFIVELAKRTGKAEDLKQFLDNRTLHADDRTRKIAELFAGVSKGVFEETVKSIPLMRGAIETVVGLRKAGFRVGIISDSFQIATENVRRRVFADFSCAHLMRFRNDKATGQITLSPAMVHPTGCREHTHCKVNVFHHVAEKFQISARHVAAIGDGENDICLLSKVEHSFAFEPKSPRVRAAAKYTVRGDLSKVLTLLLDRCELLSDEVCV
jgi:HAD superfamily phosphoserine phosphatase-like hydrolase